MILISPIFSYIKSVITEVKKVNFPTRAQAIRRTAIVIVVVLFLAAILGLFDTGITLLLKTFVFEKGA